MEWRKLIEQGDSIAVNRLIGTRLGKPFVVQRYMAYLEQAITLIDGYHATIKNDPTFGFTVSLSNDDGVEAIESSNRLSVALCKAFLALTDKTHE